MFPVGECVFPVGECVFPVHEMCVSRRETQIPRPRTRNGLMGVKLHILVETTMELGGSGFRV